MKKKHLQFINAIIFAVAFMAFTSSVDAQPEPRSFYDFEGLFGTTIADLGDAANDGELIGEEAIRVALGGIYSEDGDGKGCIELSGNPYWGNSHIEFPFADFHNSSDYTYSLWVKWTYDAGTGVPAENETWGHLLWQNGFGTEPTRHIEAWWFPGNGSIGMNLSDEDENDFHIQPPSQNDTDLNMFNGNWHQLTITLQDGVTIRIYVDGQLLEEKTAEVPIALTAETNNLWIGGKPNDPNEPQDVGRTIGFVDRVRIYDVALTIEEVATLYSSEGPEGSTVSVDNVDAKSYSMNSNTPNPFINETEISYNLHTSAIVKLDILDMLGNVITTLEDGKKQNGNHVVTWSPDVPEGVYFYRLSVTTPKGTSSDVKRMILIK